MEEATQEEVKEAIQEVEQKEKGSDQIIIADEER